MEMEPISREQVDAFARQMLDTLNQGALALMTSVGHRTGLFDVMAEMPAATSEQIAARSGLSERYVREWLGAMTTGSVVEYDNETGLYYLPPVHAACLTRASAPNNLAAAAQFLPLLGAVEDQVVAAFHHGQGVPYSAYPRFHEVMAEESHQTVVHGLEDHILPLEPELTSRLEAGIDVLDIACGRGRALMHLAQRYPASRFVGVDLSEEAITWACAETSRIGLANLRFEARDLATGLPAQAFDLVTAFDAIHDQARPAEVLASIRQALRPGGLYLMQDIGGSCHVHHNKAHPMGTYLYTVSCMHCMSVSLANGGPGLGAMWGRETALAMLATAGFREVRVEDLDHDIINCYYVCRIPADD